ncbi:hypothetical protein B0H63DRAFT_489341 [Podospora didyma]|uniref:Uncharacterized protein n=1 Tax=Podospora didyma TaxID=330526 RepID=A0AAE0N1Q5_9PEZI|nr:hypothetical protein B0H63DRAFT_489341 [Podospora didyma]
MKTVKLHLGDPADAHFHDILKENYSAQDRPIPDMVFPHPHDPLSGAVRVLSQHLVKLDLHVCGDSTLFWPANNTDLKPSWPRLKRLKVQFDPATPRGGWYFEGPMGEGRDDTRGFPITDEHYPPQQNNAEDRRWDELSISPDTDHQPCPEMFRINPINDAVEPLLTSFARALRQMPVLEEAELFTILIWHSNQEFLEDGGDLDDDSAEDEVEYSQRWGVKYTTVPQPRFVWKVGEEDWRPVIGFWICFMSLAMALWRRCGKDPQNSTNPRPQRRLTTNPHPSDEEHDPRCDCRACEDQNAFDDWCMNGGAESEEGPEAPSGWGAFEEDWGDEDGEVEDGSFNYFMSLTVR